MTWIKAMHTNREWITNWVWYWFYKVNKFDDKLCSKQNYEVRFNDLTWFMMTYLLTNNQSYLKQMQINLFLSSIINYQLFLFINIYHSSFFHSSMLSLNKLYLTIFPSDFVDNKLVSSHFIVTKPALQYEKWNNYFCQIHFHFG